MITSKIKNHLINTGSIVKKTKINPIYAELADEGQEDFYSYLEWLGLAKKPDLLILTSSHHYYFEVEDLKNVKTVLNLNQLNNIKNIKDFLQAIFSVMPYKCYFIGSFTDNKKQNGFLTSKKSLHHIEKADYISESNDRLMELILKYVIWYNRFKDKQIFVKENRSVYA